MAAIVISVAAFIHIFVPKNSKEYSAQYSLHSSIKKQRNALKSDILTLNSNYLKESINIESYNRELRSLTKKHDSLNKLSNIEYEKLMTLHNDRKVFGFSSAHKFLYTLGYALVILFVSTILFLNSKLEEEISLRKAKISVSFMGILIGFFYVGWIFGPDNDLPFIYYVLSLITCSILATTAVYFVLPYYMGRSEKLRNISKGLLDFIVQVIPAKYIADKDKDEYFNDTFNAMEKGLDE